MVDAWKDTRVIITGGTGFFGSHLVEELQARGNTPFVPMSSYYDLRRQDDIERMFTDAGPADILFHLAANVGGIGYNQLYPYHLFYDNAIMGIQVIEEAIRRHVGKIIVTGTVCAYPKFTPSPFREDNLWNGYPEETNAAYGLAKKMLLVQLQAARTEHNINGVFVLPTNLYGPRDEFNPRSSHVIPALIRKCVEARENGDSQVVVWGTGSASRDFLYVKDAARALVLIAERYDRGEPVNIGSGNSITIAGLVYHIKQLTDFEGKTTWDIGKPDGQPHRKLDISIMSSLGWKPETNLRDGLRETIAWFEQAYKEERVSEEVSIAQG